MEETTCTKCGGFVRNPHVIENLDPILWCECTFIESLAPDCFDEYDPYE